MKKKTWWLICALLMMTGGINAFSQNQDLRTMNVMKAVENSTAAFLDNIPDEILANYGIKYRAEIKRASAGLPIAVYTITHDTVSFTNTWRVPLLIDNEHRALFTVFLTPDGEYRIVDFGATILARELSAYQKDKNFRGLLRVYELHKDFLIINDTKGGFEYRPLPASEKKNYSLSDILNSIKQ